MPSRNFRQLLEVMPPARRRKIEERFEERLAAMPLDELRKARALTQVQLGEALGVHQSEIPTIEYRSDICITTLADYIEALGGRLEIRAVFPGRQILISHFDEMRL